MRPGDRNEELRFSLRSLAHYEHGTVWITGYKPSWVRNVGYIPVREGKGKKERTRANLKAGCVHPDVSERFVLFNDDFFVIEPIAEIPTLHRGPVDRVLGRVPKHTSYHRGLKRTAEKLEALGFSDPLAYEPLHTPMVMDKAGMLEALSHGAIHPRTMYGNLAQVGGRLASDCKIRGSDLPKGPFVSTSDSSFNSQRVGKLIRSLFGEPCRYEV